jgi:hypothetical protein
VRNVNVTAPGGNGNPGAAKKVGLSGDRRSRHVCRHERRSERQEQAQERATAYKKLKRKESK